MTSSSVSNGLIFQSDFSLIGNITLTSRKKRSETIKASVYAIRVERLLNKENKKLREHAKKYFKVKRVRDIIHSIVALYDHCLPDIGVQYVYDCVCGKRVYTLVALKSESIDEKIETSESDYDQEEDCLDTIDPECPDSVFAELFESDEENEENDDDENSNEEDNTLGIKSFIESYKRQPTQSHPLKRLLGISSIERVNTFQHPGQDEWVTVLQLLCVKERFRGYGIGRYLIDLIKDVKYAGQYDAIITSSDQDAIEFYEKFDFQDNPILNSKYKSIGDCWTNTTKMCFIPAYQKIDQNDSLTAEEHIHHLNLIEKDFLKWNKTMFSAYQYQAQIFAKLKQEIFNLKIKCNAQENIIQDLKLQNEIYEKKNCQLSLKLKQLNGYFDDTFSSFKSKSPSSPRNNYYDELEESLKELQSDRTEDDIEDFKNFFNNSLKNDHLKNRITIKSVILSTKLSEKYKNEYESLKYSLAGDKNYHTSLKLFINFDKEMPQEIYEDILENGLNSQKHFIKDLYGNGIYLSHYANINESNTKCLLVEALIGNCETVVKIDYDRISASKPLVYQSIITPGRQSTNNDFISNIKKQEYVVFNCKQVLPLALFICDFN